MTLIERILRLPFMKRPKLIAQVADESPTLKELTSNVLIVEIRGGYLKWAHLLCPRCGDHIQLPLAGKSRWTIKVDMLRRPTLSPSIWETQSCGAHFFVEKGNLRWCGQ
jgi:hypothetical protein